VRTSTLPWRDAGGRIVGVIGLTHDITALKLREDAERLHRKLDHILHQIVEASLSDAPLEGRMEQALHSILAIPWLPLGPKGGILLLDAGGTHLRLACQIGLPGSIQEACRELPPGRCLCGRAAHDGALVFASDVDEEPESRTQAMQPHGHYCVPLKGRSRLLGVLILYVDAGHVPAGDEPSYLLALGNALAGLIERGQAAGDVHRSRQLQAVLDSIIAVSVRPLSPRDVPRLRRPHPRRRARTAHHPGPGVRRGARRAHGSSASAARSTGARCSP
jgi:hypothetical protein